MLISLPFLTGATDDDSRGTTLGEVAGQGAFPLSHQFGWHGGMHFQAPGNPNAPESVRAIADGTVVFARASDGIPDHATDAAVMAAHPLLFYKGWTSNGVVILKHDTEIGEGVNVTFYSIYQHLHGLATRTAQQKPLAKGDKVLRKEAIGRAGAIYGQPNRIHVEFVADETNVAALMGRARGSFDGAQGRTTSVWGDTHIVVPAGTPYYATDPRDATLSYLVRQISTAPGARNETLSSIAAQFATTPERIRQLNAQLVARLRTQYPNLPENDWFSAVNGGFQRMFNLPAPTHDQSTVTVPAIWGDGPAPDPAIIPAALWASWQATPLGRTSASTIVSINENGGTLTLTTRDASGKEIGRSMESSYDLYDRSKKAFAGCHSAGYELMRFGRVLGPDALAASDQYRGRVPHLRRVRIAGSEAYLDLNVAGVKVYSDADFPDWQGWTFIDDDTDGNSRCDSQKLIELILAQLPPAPAQTPEVQAHREAMPAAQRAQEEQRERLSRAFIGTSEARVRERLKRCVVKMPTEWARDDFDQRWQWVMNQPGDLPANVLLPVCMTPQAYEKFKRHHAALAFWEDAQAAGLQLDKVHYHFHPRLFVETFKKCGWLSKGDFKKVYPNATEEKVKKYLSFINWTRIKYSLTGELVGAHFFGQAAVESNQLVWMSELYSGDPMEYFRHYECAQNYRGWLGNVQWNDGGKFRGRGLKQMTGRSNYKVYWVYRGWLNDTNVGSNWWNNLAWWGINGNYNQAQDGNRSPIQNPTAVSQLINSMRPPLIENPDIVVSDPYTCIDSAGWFWAKNSLHAIAVADDAFTLTKRIRGDRASAPNQLPTAAHYSERVENASRIKKVLGDTI